LAASLLPPPCDQHADQDDGPDGNQHPVLERRAKQRKSPNLGYSINQAFNRVQMST
jgi:hypothetical protein